MIGYLLGKVIVIEKDHLILDVNNVGYQVYTIHPYQYQINQELSLYVHTNVKEDSITLFGFENIDLKNLFLKLIQVKGVGPKTAIGILSSIDFNNLIIAIENNDVNMIKKIPGIGTKSASQIILDLKGKLVTESNININENLNDALEALMALGYKNSELNKISKQLSSEDLTTEEYIKLGLKLMLK